MAVPTNDIKKVVAYKYLCVRTLTTVTTVQVCQYMLVGAL